MEFGGEKDEGGGEDGRESEEKWREVRERVGRWREVDEVEGESILLVVVVCCGEKRDIKAHSRPDVLPAPLKTRLA